MSKKLLPEFFSRILMDSSLTFRSLIHFVFISVYGVRKLSHLFLLHVAVQVLQHHLLNRLSFSHWVFFPALWKINWLYDCGVYFWIFSSVYWFMCLFLCQYHTVLITIALWYNLKLYASSFAFLFQEWFGYSGSFVVPHKF